jgi:hypothetical protein
MGWYALQQACKDASKQEVLPGCLLACEAPLPPVSASAVSKRGPSTCLACGIGIQ